MSGETVVVLIAAVRSLACMAAIAGAVFLSYHDKDGWGWLIFVALCVGSYSLNFNGSTD